MWGVKPATCSLPLESILREQEQQQATLLVTVAKTLALLVALREKRVARDWMGREQQQQH
jgi:hypothetical protein